MDLHKKEKKNERNQQKNGNVLGHYLCIGFSLIIQQQQIHILSHMMESQSLNLDALFTYVGHLLQRPNAEHQNSSQIPTTSRCFHV
jgi:hypothetical protein